VRPRAAGPSDRRTGWRRLRLGLRRTVGRPRGAWTLAAPLLLQELALVGAGAAMTLLAARLGPAAVAAIGWVEVLAQMLHALIGAVAIGATVAAAQAVGAARRIDDARLTRRLQRRLSPLAADALALVGVGSLGLSLGLWLLREPLVDTLLPGVEPAVRAHALAYLAGHIVADVPAGLALVAAGLLRGMGRTAAATRIQLVMTASQLLLAAVCMHGLGWGVDGAALALVLSRLLALAVALRALAWLWPPPVVAVTTRPERPAAGRLRHVGRALLARWRRRGWRALASRQARAVVSVGWPTAVESGFFHVGKLLTQSLVAGSGTAALAANFIAFSICGFINIPGNALGHAGTTLIGQSLGAGQRRRAQAQLQRLHRSARRALIALALPVAAAAPALAALYSADAAVQRLAAQLVWLNALFIPVWAASFVLPAALRGAADTRYALAVATAGMWSCRVLAGWLLGVQAGWGVIGVWAGMFADWTLRGWLFHRRAQGGRWLPTVP
jgi:Na+-driven multidrug efflux pump